MEFRLRSERSKLALADERHFDCMSFRQILQPNTQGQRHSAGDPLRTKAHPNSHTLREVVDRDGYNEEPYLAERDRIRSFASCIEVLVRQGLFQSRNQRHSGEYPNDSDSSGDSTLAIHLTRRLDCGNDE
ncbi:hypothetical protein BOA8489_04053 [Boseongicola aestuarii]|uniref:Uncharacterized protein n=1 Tax=Boseongicola aestuarii TaxID=1470561 RepID=A0A238J5C4_9RHOB|nr:hypothetical protein BOA8489_04053 [Boseongicola aestuarii]